jgi:hypothetical protein
VLGAEAIAQVLRTNKTLNSLLFDDNRVTLSGYSTINYAIHNNRTLYNLPLPVADIEKQHKELTDAQYVQFFRALSKILQTVDSNRANVKIPSEEIPTPLTVEGFVTIPDFLKSVRSTITVDASLVTTLQSKKHLN